jgi:hypothetical protein
MSQTAEERLQMAIDSLERAKEDGVALDVPVMSLREVLALLRNVQGG